MKKWLCYRRAPRAVGSNHRFAWPGVRLKRDNNLSKSRRSLVRIVHVFRTASKSDLYAGCRDFLLPLRTASTTGQGSSSAPMAPEPINSELSEVPSRKPTASRAEPSPGKAPRSFQVVVICRLSHSSRFSQGPFAIPCVRISRTDSRLRCRIESAASALASSVAYENARILGRINTDRNLG
jgi:hypothetical protein